MTDLLGRVKPLHGFWEKGLGFRPSPRVVFYYVYKKLLNSFTLLIRTVVRREE